MLHIQHLLRQWVPCPPQIRDTLLNAVDIVIQPTHIFRVEAVGSGAFIETCAKTHLQTWLKTHRLFLGHNGAEIQNIHQIPTSFQDSIVVSKKILQGTLFKTIRGDCFAWAPDNQTLAIGLNQTIILWTKHAKQKHRFKVCEIVMPILITCIAWSPDSQTIAVGLNCGPMQLWTPNGHLIRIFQVYQDYTYSLEWSPDGSTLACVVDGNFVELWHPNGKLKHRLQTRATCIAWHPSGLFFTTGSQRCIMMWTKDGTLDRIHDVPEEEYVQHVAWSPDGTTLVCGLDDASIQLRTKDGTVQKTIKKHTEWISCTLWHPNSQFFASCSSRHIKFWTKDGHKYPVQMPEFDEGQTEYRQIAWSPDGTMFTSGTWNQTINLWK